MELTAMASIKLDFVHTFYDARGKLRHVFRRKGHKRITINGRPGSPEFMDAYHTLLASSGGALPVIGASRITAGTIEALVVSYLKSDAFTKALSPSSQTFRRPILDHFRECQTPSGRRYGDNRLKTMLRQDIVAVLEGKTPDVQRNCLKTIRGLIAFGIAKGECTSDPSAGIKPTRGAKSTGHMTWKPPQIAQYRKRHAVGTMARLALELMLNVAARREYAHKLGRQHMAFDAEHRLWKLTWRPSKTLRTTGRTLTIPILPDLQTALDAMPKGDALSFLTTGRGQPFASAASFGNQFADWCIEADLKPVLCDDGKVRNFRAHGLRKAAMYTLYKAGGTVAELQALGGHDTIAELQKYIQEIEQDEQAMSGLAKVATAQVKARTPQWLTPGASG
jgi:integrase